MAPPLLLPIVALVVTSGDRLGDGSWTLSCRGDAGPSLSVEAHTCAVGSGDSYNSCGRYRTHGYHSYDRSESRNKPFPWQPYEADHTLMTAGTCEDGWNSGTLCVPGPWRYSLWRNGDGRGALFSWASILGCTGRTTSDGDAARPSNRSTTPFVDYSKSSPPPLSPLQHVPGSDVVDRFRAPSPCEHCTSPTPSLTPTPRRLPPAV